MKIPFELRGAAAAGIALLFAGCAFFHAKEIGLEKRTPAEALDYYNITIGSLDELSFETKNFLFGNLLFDEFRRRPRELVRRISAIHDKEPSRVTLAVLSDLCVYLALQSDNADESVPYLLTALHCSSQLLFDARFSARDLGKFDPTNLQAVRVYNGALARLAMFLAREGRLRGTSFELISADGKKFRFGAPRYFLPFPENAYTEFLPCSDFKVKNLAHFTHDAGLGMPMVAVTGGDTPWRSLQTGAPIAHSATLFLRLTPTEQVGVIHAGLEFYDNDKVRTIAVGAEKKVPLIFDYSTPLAYYISTMPEVNVLYYMLHPADAAAAAGLYTLEPYRPEKIPVVLVHGLMSSIHTWTQMVNALKNDPEIRENYQFWFFTYSSGNPILYSAAFFRQSLLDARNEFAVTEEAQKTFDRMVVIGHSMGGLIAKTAVQNPRETLLRDTIGLTWQEVRARCTADQQETLRRLVMYEKVPSVRRVLFLAVPHRGAKAAQHSVARIGAKLIKLPVGMVTETGAIVQRLFSGQPDADALETLKTGIDGLNPDNTILQALNRLPLAPDVPCHSIIGNQDADVPGGTDGVVPYTSSHLDQVQSEFIVCSDHSVQKRPATIHEVRRILLLHLEEGRRAARETAPWQPDPAADAATKREKNPKNRYDNPKNSHSGSGVHDVYYTSRKPVVENPRKE